MFQSVADPIFRLNTAEGDGQGGLFDILALANGGCLRDLPGMRAHQRPAVVTVFAVLMHLLARYERRGMIDPAAWRAAWLESIGADALRLTAPHAEVAFLQPPTGEATSLQSIESADLLLPNVEHEVKRTWSGTPEEATFALVGSLMRPNVKDHRSGTRVGLTSVLVSDDGSIGSEILKVREAYDAFFGTNGGPGIREHLPWLRPYRPGLDAPISFGELPKPFLDVGRAQRLVVTAADQFEVRACPNNVIRISGADPWLDDPHAPREISNESVKRYKLGAKDFGAVFQHGVLFGNIGQKAEVIRPRVLDLTGYRLARLCALGTEQGKTLGYHEALYRAAKGEGAFSLEPPSAEDRAARLSQRALGVLKDGETTLYAALAKLHGEATDLNDTDKRRIADTLTAFRVAATPASVQLVFELLNGAEDIAEEQARLNRLIVDLVRDAFATATSAMVRPLAAARAELRLEQGIANKFQGAASVARQTTSPPLAQQCFAILQDVFKHLTPDDRARLRTMSLAQPPMSFWKLMAYAPMEHADSDRCVAVWKIILAGLGHIGPGRLTFGKALALEEFPESRMSRLLEGTGDTLPGLINEAARWLVSHEVKHADLTTALTLGLADALGDHRSRTWARRTIALDFAREVGRSQNKGSDGPAVVAEEIEAEA